jgi:hypothetical protein
VTKDKTGVLVGISRLSSPPAKGFWVRLTSVDFPRKGRPSRIALDETGGRRS